MSEQQEPRIPASVWSHRVSYGETDAMGVVYYANYFHWFEKARNKILLDHGLSYSEIEEQGLYLPVNETYCHYHQPARFDQLIDVRVEIGQWGRASIRFDYEVINRNLEYRKISEGWTHHAFVDGQGKPKRVPPWFREIFFPPSE